MGNLNPIEMRVLLVAAFCVLAIARVTKKSNSSGLPPGQDVVRFVEDGAGTGAGNAAMGGIGAASSGLVQSGAGTTVDVSKWDNKIAAAIQKRSTAQDQLQQAMRCSAQVATLRAAQDALDSEIEHYRNEKNRVILKAKLYKQNRDLEEVDAMSDSMREKFMDLQSAKAAIRESIDATASHLGNLAGRRQPMAPITGADKILDNMREDHQDQRSNIKETQGDNFDALGEALKLMNIAPKRSADESASDSGSASASSSSSSSKSLM